MRTGACRGVLVAWLTCGAACGSTPSSEVLDGAPPDGDAIVDAATAAGDASSDASVADASAADAISLPDDASAPDAAAVDAHVDAQNLADAQPAGDAGTVEMPCYYCHGDETTAAPPEALNGSSDTSYRGVGAHRSHLGVSDWHREVRCEYCHVVPVHILDPGHVDEPGPPADTDFIDLATGTVWDDPTCNASYCHGATLSGGLASAPVWTVVDGSQKQCDSCHGNPPPVSPHSPFTTDCGRCHEPMQPGTELFDEPARHIDGTLDVAVATDCVSCHSEPQGTRRQIVGVGADFAAASHHVDGVVQNADCVVCHDQSQHWSGVVRLKNADDPTIIVELTGAPATSAVEALKLEPFCLSCHDLDGAGGGIPFTDGIMPPPIDAIAWGGTTHKSSSLTCMGDGGSFGCHDNGHGSAKRKLLAPADASQPPVPGDPLREEEGMCYSCHSAGGVATADTEAEFSTGSHHPVSLAEQGSGALVECRNCHDPHLASLAAPLIDPDNGAAWPNVDYTDFCLRCHDGSPPPEVAFSAIGSPDGSGFDKSAYVGTTHDQELGSGSAYGCMHCHHPHGSENLSTLVDTYEVADYNNYAASDYALCFRCHTASSVVTGANAFEDLHDKHVRGEDAPCIICHDPHVAADASEPGLISFAIADNGSYDFSYSGASTNPSNSFWEAPSGDRYCRLRCHGRGHSPENYDPTRDGPVDTTSAALCTACHP